MHLVQMLLPVRAEDGRPFARELFDLVRDEIVDEFGGLTAHVRAPATGLWRESDDARAVRDDVVLFEVMVETLDHAWWSAYRDRLQQRFEQDELVIRAVAMERL